MNEELVQIGLRLKGLRDAMEMTQEGFAESCNINMEEYKLYELGQKDISVSVLKNIADRYQMDLNTLMFDEEPRMKSYALTRREKGLETQRAEGYQYQTLVSGFANRKADIFVVTVDPLSEGKEMPLRTHTGQEFCLLFKGRLMININGKELILEKGDSLYFDPSLPHGMKALDGKVAKFLTVVM